MEGRSGIRAPVPGGLTAQEGPHRRRRGMAADVEVVGRAAESAQQQPEPQRDDEQAAAQFQDQLHALLLLLGLRAAWAVYAA